MGLLIENISKKFGNYQALVGIDLEIKNGSRVALIGSSGSGKSTLLRILAGFEKPDSGRIWIGGQDVTTQPVQERDIGFVFQNYALFPHSTVAQNIQFGLDVRGVNKETTRKRVQELIQIMQLDHCIHRYPYQLSGGQRQRVALARALAVEPRVLLLDEPFAALDIQIRKHLVYWLRHLHEHIPVTTVFVTHDPHEACNLAHEIIILSHGKIIQIGTPQEIIDTPARNFVMDFLEVNLAV